MLTSTPCCCGGNGRHKSLWCDILKGNAPVDILHLWYKFSWLQDEIEKRSSYLGKFRRTEEAQHLLDLIAMTKDEEDLFYPFARAAAGDVFDIINRYTPHHEKAYLWKEGENTVHIDPLPTPDWDGTSNSCSYSGSTIYSNLGIQLQQEIDETYKVALKVKIDYTTSYTIKATGDVITKSDFAVKYVPLEFDEGQGVWEKTISFDLELAGEGAETTAEVISSVSSAKIESVIVLWANPVTFKEGDWVEYDSKLYKAVADGDANNMLDGQLVESQDFRMSIHYLIGVPKVDDLKDINMVVPLDTAVFEALVNRIIYKWLVLAYPAEAEVYLNNYNEAIAQVRYRCDALAGTHIIKRTPRYI